MFAGEYDFKVDLDGTLIVYDFEIPDKKQRTLETLNGEEEEA